MMRKKMCAVWLALLLLLSVAAPASAAPADTPAAISITATVKGRVVTADVTLSNAAGATNGRIVVEYDADILTLLSAEVGSDSWISSLNQQTDGRVALAWVASDLAEGENRMLKLQFRAVDAAAASTELTAALEQLYRSSDSLLGEGGEDANTASCAVNLNDGTVTPVQPLPAPDPKPQNPGTATGPRDIAGHWAESYILEGYEKGLVNGTSDTTFSPDALASRGQFATVLWRIAGSPKATSASPFTDVKSGSYYEEAVNWAYEKGILTGTSATTVSPDRSVTRQEVVTMVYRYGKAQGMDVSAAGSLAGFADADQVASYAVEAMTWSVGAGVIQGSNGLLAPERNITRAEMATILVRFADQ